MIEKKLNVRKSYTTYTRLMHAIKPYWFCFTIGAVSTILVSIADATFAWLIKPIIDKGFIDRDATFIHWMPIIIIIIFIGRSSASFLSSYGITRVARSIVRDFRHKIFSHLLQLPAKFYDRNNSGHLLSVTIYNVEQVAQASSNAFLILLTESSLAIGLVIVMLTVSWQLFMLCLLMTPVIAFVIKWSGSRMRRLSRIVQESVGDVTHVAGESINGYKVIRLFGGQNYEKNKFESAIKNNWVREIKVAITTSSSTAIVQFLLSILIAVALVIATVPSLDITAGAFGTIISSMMMLLRPMRRLTLVNSDIQKGIAGADGIFRVLDEKTEIDQGKHTIKNFIGNIEYRNVFFSYDASSNQILQDISFKIKPGQTVAIVGRSGSGKTTLVNLLPRFYEIDSGEIIIDGINIKDYQLSALRMQFALVSQQTVLFNDTIARNIAYGLKEHEATHEQIIAAAEAAYAMEFISELPQGLNTKIGENGVLLSGGQRQRIAIARALLKKAPILILDEATSSLDTDAERQIQTALNKLMKQCTTLVIAHRLSTIENADWILVMDNGRLLEQGTHESLIKNDDLYAYLHRLQFKDSEYIPVGFQEAGEARAKSSSGACIEYVSSEMSTQQSQNLKGDGYIPNSEMSHVVVKNQ